MEAWEEGTPPQTATCDKQRYSKRQRHAQSFPRGDISPPFISERLSEPSNLEAQPITDMKAVFKGGPVISALLMMRVVVYALTF